MAVGEARRGDFRYGGASAKIQVSRPILRRELGSSLLRRLLAFSSSTTRPWEDSLSSMHVTHEQPQSSKLRYKGGGITSREAGKD